MRRSWACIWFCPRQISNSLIIVFGLYFSKGGTLYSACGDSQTHAWDLNDMRLVNSFEGHTDYVHCVEVRQNGQVVTGSEDGTVRLWGMAVLDWHVQGRSYAFCCALPLNRGKRCCMIWLLSLVLSCMVSVIFFLPKRSKTCRMCSSDINVATVLFNAPLTANEAWKTNFW